MGNCQKKEDQIGEHEIDTRHKEEDSFNKHFQTEKKNLLIKNDEMKKYVSLNSQSVVSLPEDVIYSGKLHDSRANGVGTLRSETFVFRGDFVNGKPNGKGTLTYTNGEEYNGDLVNGFFHGNGCFKSNQGFTYNGEFKMNKFDGQGKCVWVNGNEYEGEFKGNVFHGLGKYRYVDGKEYGGMYKGGLKHGEGMIIIPDKNFEFKGGWEDGKLVRISSVKLNEKSLPVELFDMNDLN